MLLSQAMLKPLLTWFTRVLMFPFPVTRYSSSLKGGTPAFQRGRVSPPCHGFHVVLFRAVVQFHACALR